jgi:hypothetical protein
MSVIERNVKVFVPRTAPDERPARRSLLDQIARLEEELSQLFCSTWPRKGFDWEVPPRGGPRVLSLSELEGLRDDLVRRVQESRRALADRTYAEEQNRCLIEEMQLDPESHKWIRVSNEDIGEPGCRHWHVRPRFGLVGMLMSWWRVVVSSGCPLATPRGAATRRRSPRRARPRRGLCPREGRPPGHPRRPLRRSRPRRPARAALPPPLRRSGGR